LGKVFPAENTPLAVRLGGRRDATALFGAPPASIGALAARLVRVLAAFGGAGVANLGTEGRPFRRVV
jgi:hypothetical protein